VVCHTIAVQTDSLGDRRVEILHRLVTRLEIQVVGKQPAIIVSQLKLYTSCSKLT